MCSIFTFAINIQKKTSLFQWCQALSFKNACCATNSTSQDILVCMILLLKTILGV